MGYWERLEESVFQLESLPTGFLSCVLMEVAQMPAEKGLCTAVPCRLEFPKESLNNSMITGYWINKNISSAVATSELNAAVDDNTSERSHIIWNLEEQDCTLLTHDVLRRDNMTYLSSADQEEQKSTLLRENITLFLSGDIQSHAMGGLERRNYSRGLVIVWFLPHRALGFTKS